MTNSDFARHIVQRSLSRAVLIALGTGEDHLRFIHYTQFDHGQNEWERVLCSALQQLGFHPSQTSDGLELSARETEALAATLTDSDYVRLVHNAQTHKHYEDARTSMKALECRNGEIDALVKNGFQFPILPVMINEDVWERQAPVDDIPRYLAQRVAANDSTITMLRQQMQAKQLPLPNWQKR